MNEAIIDLMFFCLGIAVTLMVWRICYYLNILKAEEELKNNE